jgi:RNA polymerase sigma factor (sigma-70 family)
MLKKKETLKNRDEINKIVSNNLGLVRFVAHNHYKSSNLSFEDRMGEGILGLIRAAELYKEETGYKFSTFAVPWIKLYIRDAVNLEKRHFPGHIVSSDDELIFNELSLIPEANSIDPLIELLIHEIIFEKVKKRNYWSRQGRGKSIALSDINSFFYDFYGDSNTFHCNETCLGLKKKKPRGTYKKAKESTGKAAIQEGMRNEN